MIEPTGEQSPALMRAMFRLSEVIRHFPTCHIPQSFLEDLASSSRSPVRKEQDTESSGEFWRSDPPELVIEAYKALRSALRFFQSFSFIGAGALGNSSGVILARSLVSSSSRRSDFREIGLGLIRACPA